MSTRTRLTRNGEINSSLDVITILSCDDAATSNSVAKSPRADAARLTWASVAGLRSTDRLALRKQQFELSHASD